MVAGVTIETEKCASASQKPTPPCSCQNKLKQGGSVFEKLHYYYDYKDNLNGEEKFLDEGFRPGLLADFLGSQSPDLVN